MALNTLVAGSASDSYVSVPEANTYIASRPDSKNWNDEDYKERERLLRQSTIDIDLFMFKGTKLFQGGEGGGLEAIAQSSIYNVLSEGYQRLAFPRHWQEYYTGYPDSGSTTTLVDASFASPSFPREDGYFTYGAIYILNGTNKGESRSISNYVSSTGTFTVSTAFTNAINSSTNYLIITPIDRYVKYAVIEQALFLSNSVELQKLSQWRDAGVSERAIGDVRIKFSGSGGSTSSMDKIGGFMSSNAFRYIQRFLEKNRGSGRG